MNSSVFIGIVILIFIGLSILSIPIFLTFLLYRKLRTKGETKKKLGIVIFAITASAMIFLVLHFLISGVGFGPEYDKVEINQKIGGTLICSSTYNADFHDWQYDVKYEYKPLGTDSTIKIGCGEYYASEWNKDEQLIQFKKWTILKTGDRHGHDKIIIGDLKKNKWTEYGFYSMDIEREKIWIKSKIYSISNNCCQESFITKIENGLIQVHFKFKTNEKTGNEYSNRQLFYKIDEETGKPIMTSIR